MIAAVRTPGEGEEFLRLTAACRGLGALTGSAFEMYREKPASGWSFYLVRAGEGADAPLCAALALRRRSAWLLCREEEACAPDPEELDSFLTFLGVERLTTPGPGPAGWQSRPLALFEPGPDLVCPAAPAGLILDTEAAPAPVAALVMAGKGEDAREDFYAEACARRNHGFGRYWLARGSEGAPAATVSAWAVWRGLAYMAMGLTAPEQRGKGLGSWIIPAMAKALLAEGLAPHFLCREALIPFYTAQGMIQTGEYKQYYTESSEFDPE